MVLVFLFCLVPKLTCLIFFQYDESLKLINSTLNHFNDFIKKHEEPKPEKVKEKDSQSNEH